MAVILAYLGVLLWPPGPHQQVTDPTPTSGQFQLPSAASTAVPRPTLSGQAPEGAESVVGPPAPATNYARRASMFDEERALEHLAYLASDELGGRQPGTPGGRAAGDYIAARFAEYGLEPAGLGSTYFQTFTVSYGRITEPPVLTIIPPRGEALTRTYAYRTDYRALTGGYLGAGAGEGPVVWLNECLHDDYAGLDMVGKIALCRYTRSPEVYRQAIEHRVGGLLLLDREREDEPFRRGGYRETAWVPQTIPAYLISETVAEDLLTGTGYALDDLSLRFTATPLSTTVRMAVALEEQEAVEARNVLGFLPGCDPQHSDDVVVIGAHYDHLGREPDRATTIMNGANDNASGVATILEVARLWQAQSFCPARSILFATWDGEEQGLLGSQHYVQNPTYPLTRTIAMLNLDMVGTGEALQIDGEGAVAAQLRASAGVYGITTTLTFNGRSDHMSFYSAGVPAAMLIWWPDVFYHTPGDKVAVIEAEKLKTVGVLSAHALAALAQGHVELEQAVERLRASVAAGDRESFLEGLDPTDPDLRAAQAAWFDNLWSQELTEVTIEPGQMRIGDGEADVTLMLAYRWANATRRAPSASYDVRFVQREDTWVFAGYELDTLSGGVVTVACFPDVPVEAHRLLSDTQQAYLSLSADLGLEPITGTRFIYYPDGATMRAIARPAASHDTRWLVSSAGLAEIAWGQPITPVLVNLALNQMGLPPDEGAWLREGLVLHYELHRPEEPVLGRPEEPVLGRPEEPMTDRPEEMLMDREYLPALADTDVLTSPLDFPALSDLPDSEARALRGLAWSATEYLLDRYGISGLRALCAAWDATETGTASSKQPGDQDTAFRQALGLSLPQFESAWRADRLDPLHADAEDIRATIAARVEAVLEGNAAGFLSTVTPANPSLRIEERNWFADLAHHPVVTYSATGELVGWPQWHGQEAPTTAVVALTVRSVISGGQSSQATCDARFVREDGHWLYAGVAWDERASDHFVLKHQDHDEAWAQHVLDLAEAAYGQVTADLDATPPLPVEIKVYDDGELFRTSVALSLPDWASGWTEPGEAIKLPSGDGSDSTLQRIIARELAHQVLFGQGLLARPASEGASASPEAATGQSRGDWLHEGVASFEAGRVIPLGTHWMAGEYLPVVQEAIRRHNEFPLYNLPSWEEVPDEQVELLYAQSWSVISFIVEQHGLPGLRRFIAQSATSDDTAASLRAALGVDPESFLAEWREHTRIAGAPDGLVSLAQCFDPEHALADITVLSNFKFGGREAGTAGADMAAAYIAGQFAALGLEPLGDKLTITSPLTETSPLTGTGTGGAAYLQRDYVQRFPISHTHLISVPTLTLLDGEGTVFHEFVYREDFMESAGEGAARPPIAGGELVLVRADTLEGMHFGGAVVLERDVRDPIARAVQLQDRGAGGLIVALGRESNALQTDHVRLSGGGRDLPYGSAATIPVFEITDAAFDTLLERLGMTTSDLAVAPPALPLGVQVQQTLARSPVTTTLTANVLALLPGSDRHLMNEVLVVGAHYDHIGQSPDGLYFPGANRNGSGVGALLEMVRVWKAEGYRPARSVLFAAWGAEELDSAGVTHYLAHPAVPLTQTVGVIALDSIAAGQGYKLLFYGTREYDLPLIQRLEASAVLLDRRAWRRGSTGEGWHTAFSSAHIPTLKLIWDGAEETFYLPSDDVDNIDPERLASSGEILTLATAWLTSQ